jgi:hypothetical protein
MEPDLYEHKCSRNRKLPWSNADSILTIDKQLVCWILSLYRRSILLFSNKILT